MTIFKRTENFIFLFLLIFLVSCTFKKKLIYFQGSEANPGAKNYTPVFHNDDFLYITVLGLDPEITQPFNLPVTNFNNNTSGGYSQGNASPYGYLIDANGNIDFPVIGTIKMAGLTRMEATVMLKEKLNIYLNKPVVNIRILNFKVTVLGDVRNPGTFNIPNERITLPEAIGIAGDLNITGIRKNVLVIRDVDGTKVETRVDLTSNELFSSPVYYLNQNDVVYVQPNRAKINSSVLNTANVGIAISVLSLVITMVTLLSR